MVFQDPYSSLNPRLTVGRMLAELLLLHKIVPRREVRAESIRLLNLVGLEEEVLGAYPSQFSGGQRQRLAIARALAVRPDVLIADEPVSALDVSVQATILELFTSLRAELGLSILFIAHNLAVVQHLSDRVAVMYLGRIVEVADTRELFAHPRHPYTRALIDSIPRMREASVNDAFELDGEPPSPYDVPAGCRFHPRCALAQRRSAARPTRRCSQVGPAHESACLKADELAAIPLPEAPHRSCREDLDVVRHGGRRRHRRLGPVPAQRRCPLRDRLPADARRGQRRHRGRRRRRRRPRSCSTTRTARWPTSTRAGSPAARATSRAGTSRAT